MIEIMENKTELHIARMPTSTTKGCDSRAFNSVPTHVHNSIVVRPVARFVRETEHVTGFEATT